MPESKSSRRMAAQASAFPHLAGSLEKSGAGAYKDSSRRKFVGELAAIIATNSSVDKDDIAHKCN
jgi:hypothetical protein